MVEKVMAEKVVPVFLYIRLWLDVVVVPSNIYNNSTSVYL